MPTRCSLLRLGLPALCVASAFGQAQFSAREPRYILAPLDTVEVHYRYSPEFDQTVTIQPDGFVSLPLLGDVRLQGLTLDQARATILDKAAQRLKDPEIVVVLKDFEKPYFVVGGEVNTPGRFEMRGPVTALQAISIAGGFKSASAKHSQVIRYKRIGPDLVKGEILDMKTLMNPHASTEPLATLQPGDILIVPQNTISKVERIVKLANIGAYFPIPVF